MVAVDVVVEAAPTSASVDVEEAVAVEFVVPDIVSVDVLAVFGVAAAVVVVVVVVVADMVVVVVVLSKQSA